MKFIFTLLSALILTGCAVVPQWNSELPYQPSQAPQVGDILHLETGHYVSEKQMLANTGFYPLVYVGEVHDNPASHTLQLKVLKAMVKRRPGKVALGMEMFTAEQQVALDKWVAGELDERAFLKESRMYSEGWGHYYELYRELLEYCRDNQIPIVGLNVDKKLARTVAMTPLTKLELRDRERIPEMDMQDRYQRTMIQEIFGAHIKSNTMLESFYRRQTLWDETMAQSVADYMKSNMGMRMLVIAGGWHIEYGFGIPRRVHRRLPIPYLTIGGETLTIPVEKQGQMMDVDMPEFPMPPVDYLAFQEYEIFKKKGVSLGVLIDDSEAGKGVKVTGVIPGSTADKAGIKKGNYLLRLDGERLNESFDLVYAVKQKSEGDKAALVVKDEQGERTVAVTFISVKKRHGK